jgi:hypothetical protein
MWRSRTVRFIVISKVDQREYRSPALEIVGSNFFWTRIRSITLFRTRTRLIKLTRTFYSFKNVLIFSKFFSNSKLSVGLKIQNAFIRLLIWKLAHLVYFSENFEGDFIKIKSYLVLFMRRRSSGPKKFGPGPGPYPEPTGSGSYPTISTLHTERRFLEWLARCN